MADIRIKDLPLATGGTAPTGTDDIAIDGLTTRKTNIAALGDVAVPVASQAEAEAGSNASKRMTPLTTKQSIASEVGVTLASAAEGDLASTALQPGDAVEPSDIGVTIQPYSANLSTLSSVTPGSAGTSILALSLSADVRSFLETSPYVATRTALKALDTTKDKTVLLTEAGREGLFLWKSGNYAAQITADTTEGVFIKANAIASSSGAWVRFSDGIFNVKWFGAKGDGATNDGSVITTAFSVATSYGIGLYSPKGTYILDAGAASYVFDFVNAQYGFSLSGDGLSLTTWRVNNVNTAAGTSAINFIYSGPAVGGLSPQYDKYIRGMTIRSSHNGPTLTLAKNDFSDTFETALFERFAVINEHPVNAVSEALRLNLVLGCTFMNSRVGCYADGVGNNYGTGLRLRKASFNTFVNFDYGNALRGADFTDVDSYGNVFTGGGSENCAYHVSIRSGNATDNTFIGGRYSLWTIYAIQGTAGDRNVFKNVRFNNGAGPATVLDPANYTGVTIESASTVTTPSMPASTVAVNNTTGKTVCVRIGNGSYSVVTVNGFGMSRTANGDWTEWTLPSGGSIAITYSSAPSWSWISPNF